eukprot:485193_1
MSNQEEEINKLKAIGSTLFEQFSNQIVSVLNDMKISIDALNKRVEILEQNVGGNNSKSETNTTKKPSSSIKVPKKNDKVSKSAPTTPKASTKKPRNSSRLSRLNKKKEAEPEPEPEPEPEAEAKKENEDNEEKEEETDENVKIVKVEKVRGQKKKIKFLFQNDHNIIKQADNGGSAIKPKFKGGTIRFGKFVGKKDGDFEIYLFKFDTRGMGSTSSG